MHIIHLMEFKSLKHIYLSVSFPQVKFFNTTLSNDHLHRFEEVKG